MEHYKIDRRARVWTVTRGADGKLQEELDEALLASLAEAASGCADPCVETAAKHALAATRVW